MMCYGDRSKQANFFSVTFLTRQPQCFYIKMENSGYNLEPVKSDSNRIKILKYVADEVLRSGLLLKEDERYIKLAWPVFQIPEKINNQKLITCGYIVFGGISVAAAIYTKQFQLLPLISLPACFAGAKHLYISFIHCFIKKCIKQLIDLLQKQNVLNKKILYYLEHRTNSLSQLGVFVNNAKLSADVRRNEINIGIGFIFNSQIICKELCKILKYYKNKMQNSLYNNILEYSEELHIPVADFKVEKLWTMFSDITNFFLLTSSSALTIIVLALFEESTNVFVLYDLLPNIVKIIKAKLLENKQRYFHINNKLKWLDEMPPLPTHINNPHCTIFTQFMDKMQISFDIALALTQFVTTKGKISDESIISLLKEMLIYHNSTKNAIEILLQIYSNNADVAPLPSDLEVLQLADLYNLSAKYAEKEEEIASYFGNDDVDKSIKNIFATNCDWKVDLMKHKILIQKLQAKLDLLTGEKKKVYKYAMPSSMGLTNMLTHSPRKEMLNKIQSVISANALKQLSLLDWLMPPPILDKEFVEFLKSAGVLHYPAPIVPVGDPSPVFFEMDTSSYLTPVESENGSI